MRITLPNVFAFFIASFMMLTNVNANNPEADFCLNADIPEAQMDFKAMCLTAPMMACPSTYLGCVGDNLDPSNTGFATAQPGDQFCPTPIVTYSDEIVSNSNCMVMIHRTWDATYPSGSASIKLHSSCQQTLILEDTSAPVINNCPSNITVDLADNCDGIAVWNIPTATDDCGVEYFTTTHFAGSSFPVGTTTVTYEASDFCDQITTCSFTVTVGGSCCTTPNIFCPGNIVACPGGGTTPSTTGMATATTADPSCPTPTITFADNTNNQGGCNGSNVFITRTWTATDPTNSSFTSSCVQTISSLDTQPPSITNIPPDMVIPVNGTNCSTPVSWTAPSATDNCGVASFTSNFNSGMTFPQGSTLVTYTAVDNCGNQSTAAFQITIQCVGCNSSPIISCPSNYFGCPSTSAPSASVSGTATATPGSNMCGNPIITSNDVVISSSGGSCNNQTIQRTWTATDPVSGNFSTSCVQTITLADTQLPSISNVPSNITVTGTGTGCSAQATWNAPFITDNCGLASTSSNFNSGSSFPQGTTTVTYTAVDNCGNQRTASFTVTVNCTTACNANPILNCPSNYFGCPTGTVPHPNISGTGFASAGSSMCGNPIVTYNDIVTSSGGSSCNAQTVQRTWTATDPVSGNFSTSCVQTLNLVDNQPPVISNVPSSITLTGTGNGCSAQATWSVPTATDNCGIASLSTNFNSGSFFPQGTTTVTYVAVDNCGNNSNASFTVTVNCMATCNVPPTIACPSNYSSCPTSGLPSTSIAGMATGFAGSGSCSAPIVTFNDITISNGPCANAKVVQRTWTARDPNNSNLSASCNQTITLSDNQNPFFINCPSSITVNGSGTNCVVPVSWGTVMASDNCVTPSITSVDQNGNFVNSGSSFNQGTSTVTYTATDGCNNTATCIFNVTVSCAPSCNTAPSISCPNSLSLCVGSNTSTAALGNATASGGANCPAPIVNFSDQIISQGNCGDRVINRIFTASYPSASNLTTSCQQTITLTDTSVPTFVNCPSNITVSNPNAPVTWTAPYATDVCGTPNITSNFSPGSIFPVGVTTVIYTAVDACGNSTSCSFTVSVNINSTITCPNDIIAQCGTNGGAHVNWAAPTYEGTCTSCNNGNYIPGFIYMGTLNGNQYYCSLSPATWANASHIAESNGGYLASIGSAQENSFLSNMLQIQSAWIGLNDIQNEGHFEWTSGEPLTYTNWYVGQPNNYNGTQHCVEILNNGSWNDQYGSYQLEFIMEKPCSTVDQISGPAPGSFLTAGTYTVAYQINDACGSVDQCSFNITVESGLAITCPNNIQTSAPSNSAGVAVNWNPPTVNSCCTDCGNASGAAIPGFVYMGTFNGNYYYCSLQSATWPTAKTTCEANGGYLAVVNNSAENEFLANLLIQQSAWIGCTDVNSEGHFQWVNGDALTYTNWYPGQPNNYNGNQDYVEMLSNGQWNDQYNNFALEYIMEVPGCVNVTQTAGPAPGSILAPGSNHVVTYTATDGCGNLETCSFNINVTSVQVGNGYCPSRGNHSSNYFIQSVLFGSIISKSGDNGGYKDFTSQGCVTVSPGTSIPLQLTPGFAGVSPTKVYWKVWIDYNMDGDFDDASEYVANGCHHSTLSGMITMPYNLWNGTTVMRVAMKLGSYPASSCDIFSFGEVEDYCVKIINADVASGDDLEKRNNNSVDAVLLSGIADRSEVEVFPNPVSEYLTVNLSQATEVSMIQLFSIEGKMVHDIDGTDISERNQIDVTRYESGMYLIRVFHTDGEVSTQKITIHH